ncbi:MAG TPA: ABC transporter substrate-binding protein [Anaerolineae bacterium]|nr:ABC transporter substrate-binding protein [Anaerolineae bacterium]
MKKRNMMILLLTMIMVFTACTPETAEVTTVEETTSQIALIDGLGREVILEKPADTVISLATSNTEILYAVGAGEQAVGRDSFSDYPTEALELTDIGGDFSRYDLETIVSLDPDLVLVAEINTSELVQSIEDLGITVFYIKNPVDFTDLYVTLQDVALLTGHKEETEELIDALKARVADVEEKIAGVAEKPTVFYELDASDPAKPYTPGPGTFHTTIIEMAGGTNIGAVLDSAWAQISLEELLVQDPEYILLGDAMWGTTPETVAEREGWSALTAVNEDRVLPFDDNLLSRPGPRLVNGLEELAKILHPNLFD